MTRGEAAEQGGPLLLLLLLLVALPPPALAQPQVTCTAAAPAAEAAAAEEVGPANPCLGPSAFLKPLLLGVGLVSCRGQGSLHGPSKLRPTAAAPLPEILSACSPHCCCL